MKNILKNAIINVRVTLSAMFLSNKFNLRCTRDFANWSRFNQSFPAKQTGLEPGSPPPEEDAVATQPRRRYDSGKKLWKYELEFRIILENCTW
jgi:hypothetical protein